MTILVVEDDADVLRCLATMLQSCGFAVSTAGGGKEAVHLYGQHRDDIELVLLDVQMPEMDGPQTLALLRGINPAVRVVFMSGYTPYSTQELLEMGALSVLEKPFGLAELGKTVRSLVSEP